MHQITYTLTTAVTPTPQLEVFRSVVYAIAVLVMNGFMREQRAAENFFHNNAMFLAGACSSTAQADDAITGALVNEPL